MISSRNLGKLNTEFVCFFLLYDLHFYFSVDIHGLNLAIDKCSRADSLFYKNQGSRILVNLSESLELSNTTLENIEV